MMLKRIENDGIAVTSAKYRMIYLTHIWEMPSPWLMQYTFVIL